MKVLVSFEVLKYSYYFLKVLVILVLDYLKNSEKHWPL